MNYVDTKFSDKRLFLIGKSLGGAVGTYAASLKPDLFDGVILENTFTSMSDVVDDLFYLVSFFKPLVLRIDWDTRSLITELRAPLLIVGGSDDELIPVAHSKQLYDVAR